MKKTKRIMTGILVLLMAITLFAGCTMDSGDSAQQTTTTTPKKDDGSQTTGPEELKEAKVKLYLYGYNAPSDDQDMVMDEINRILKEKINATIELTIDMYADATQKTPLIIAAGEDYDGIHMNDANFQAEIQKGGLREIGDLLMEYMPRKMEGMTDYDYSAISFNDKVYAMPGGHQNFNPQGYMIRGDLRKKYNIPEVKSLDDLQTYMDVLMEKEPGVIPYNTSAGDNMVFFTNFHGPENYIDLGSDIGMGYYVDDPESKLTFFYEIDAYKDYLNKAKEFADKGYWSKNAYAAKTISIDGFKAGTSFVAGVHAGNANDTALIFNKTQPDWEVEFYRIPTLTQNRPTRGRSFTIPVASKNPERAIMVCELLTFDPELNSLLIYGIKDLHYVVNADDTIESTEVGSARFPADTFPLCWNHREASLIKQMTGGLEDFYYYQQNKEKYSIIPKHAGFVLDKDAIANEMAAITAINKEMKTVADFGVFDDADKFIEEYKKRMDTAGAAKVKEECQRQLDAFLAGK